MRVALHPSACTRTLRGAMRAATLEALASRELGRGMARAPRSSMSPVPVRPSRRVHKGRDVAARLPHWSDVPADQRGRRPSPQVAAVLRDLVSWAADIAVALTRHTPEDHDAIERVRSYTLAWLSDTPCPEVGIEDVLTTTATLLAGIDRNLTGSDTSDEGERAIGAAVAE